MSGGAVLGVADAVKLARKAIQQASDAAVSMRATASDIVDTVKQVAALQADLDAAHDELKSAVAQLGGNGGPPLDSSTTSETQSQPSQTPNSAQAVVDQLTAAVTASAEAGRLQVQNLNQS